MKVRLTALTLVVALLSVLVLTPVSAHAASQAPTTNSVTVPVTTSVPGLPGGMFTGVLTITNFSVNQAGQLVANGTVTGTVTQTVNGVTTTVGTVTNQLFQAVVGTTGTCPILDLTIGPINLDLLGLVVQTNTIHLTITAQSGPGNLLGNLLCAVANLLNQGNTSVLANLLNHLLGILNLSQI